MANQYKHYYGNLYLTGMTSVYLFAFLSIYIQMPGLFGADGLMPMSSFASRIANSPAEGFERLPSILWYHKAFGFEDIGVFAEFIALSGALLSAGMISSSYWSGPGLAVLWFLYLSIFQLGQTFLGFQWDILLLEAGLITIFYVPHLMKKKTDPLLLFPSPAIWCTRWLLFKLMLMSGAVKLQADCPTWNRLTALEYHYATQCLPTPLAWWAHQLPPLLHRAAVAATLWVELPCTLMLILPFKLARRIGVTFQVLLQVLITLTGNYGFFNVITMVLCIPSWWEPADENRPRTGTRPGSASLEELGPILWVGALISKLVPFVGHKTMNFFTLLASAAFMIWSGLHMISVETHSDASPVWGGDTEIVLKLTKDLLENLIVRWLPFIFTCYGCIMILSSCNYTASSLNNRLFLCPSDSWFGCKRPIIGFMDGLRAFSVGSFLFVLFCISCVPFASLHHQSLQAKVPQVVGYLFQNMQRWRPAAGYGLFRRMTGVGAPPPPPAASFAAWPSVGGLPLPVVARPEVIIEGSVDEGRTWQEIPFKFKPNLGSTESAMKYVAPHMPRLDWQMWFAALGPYQNQPWIIHLLHKVLEGCSPDVLELLGDGYPFRDNPPSLVRSKVIHYDFTRLETNWSRADPFANIVSQSPFELWNIRDDSNRREYTPALRRGDPSVQSFLAYHGWDGAGRVRRRGSNRASSVCESSAGRDSTEAPRLVGLFLEWTRKMYRSFILCFHARLSSLSFLILSGVLVLFMKIVVIPFDFMIALITQGKMIIRKAKLEQHRQLHPSPETDSSGYLEGAKNNRFWQQVNAIKVLHDLETTQNIP